MIFDLNKFVHHFPNEKIEGDLNYLTAPDLPIQFGIHEPKEDRVSKMHFHKFFCEFFYVERGEIVIEFTDPTFEITTKKTIKQGESFVMFPGIGHSVYLPKGCRVIEVHPGPYVNDKVFNEE